MSRRAQTLNKNDTLYAVGSIALFGIGNGVSYTHKTQLLRRPHYQTGKPYNKPTWYVKLA